MEVLDREKIAKSVCCEPKEVMLRYATAEDDESNGPWPAGTLFVSTMTEDGTERIRCVIEPEALESYLIDARAALDAKRAEYLFLGDEHTNAEEALIQLSAELRAGSAKSDVLASVMPGLSGSATVLPLRRSPRSRSDFLQAAEAAAKAARLENDPRIVALRAAVEAADAAYTEALDQFEHLVAEIVATPAASIDDLRLKIEAMRIQQGRNRDLPCIGLHDRIDEESFVAALAADLDRLAAA
jgi:hypothetical protein